jgi:hypothetical protein
MIYSEENLIEGCVEKLKNLGFLNATKENIFQDEVYKYHLKPFINSLKGHTDNLDKAIKELVLKMEKNK